MKCSLPDHRLFAERLSLAIKGPLPQFDFRYRQELKKVIPPCADDSFITAGRAWSSSALRDSERRTLPSPSASRRCSVGYVVRFIRVQTLLNPVLADRDLEPRERVGPQAAPDLRLLILDEFGYLSHPVDVGPLLYEAISGRCELKATIDLPGVLRTSLVPERMAPSAPTREPLTCPPEPLRRY